MPDLDPVTLEVIRNRLRSISKEMVITLTKTAYSSVIYDGKDCSCAVLDAQGQLLTLDAGLPLHIAPMPFSVREVVRDFQDDIHPGDIFMVNSPYRGGTHLPDVLVLLPVFAEGKPVFMCAARGHWTDVGGAAPGSLSGKATEIHQEGLLIPPIKLYEGGRPNDGAHKLILGNVRVAEERAGDIRAQVAACKTAERRLLELLDKYSLDTVTQACREILDASENYVRSVFRALPDLAAGYEDYLDSDGTRDISLRIQARASIEDDELFVDFTGTAPQSQGPYNVSLAVSTGAVVIASKILFDPYGPMNEGVFRPIKVTVPEGTLLNARYPAATGGFGEVAYRAIFTVIGALAQAVPQRASGSDYGAINHCYITTKEENRHSIFYAYPPGGNGGTYMTDGPSGLRGPSSGDVALQSLETVEARHPLLFKSLHFRPDSGGPGAFRGGLGMYLSLQVLSETGGLNIVSDRTYIPPFGIFGGHAGHPNEWKVLRGDETHLIPWGKTVNHPLQKGDIVVMGPGGAGGYGDPLDRDPLRVLQDVQEGLVSADRAEDAYGVVLVKDGKAVDREATKVKRSLIRSGRTFLQARRIGGALFERGIRVLTVSDEAELKGRRVNDGELVELVSPNRAAPLRFRIRRLPGTAKNEALIDDEAWNILGCTTGQEMELRSIEYRR